MSKTVTLTDAMVAEIYQWLKREIPHMVGHYEYLCERSKEEPENENYSRAAQLVKEKLNDASDLLKQLEG